MRADEVETVADRLHRAEREGRPVDPITDEYPRFGMEDAYRVQEAVVRHRTEEGEVVVGAKLGFTSLAMRRALGVDEPNHGWLTDAMLLDGGALPWGNLIHPKVEPEVGFLLGRELAGGGATVSDVLAATDSVFLCLEVVDSRFREYRFRVQDNTADNSSAARVLVGGRAVRPGAVDLATLGVVLWADGKVVATAAGGAVMGHPARAVAWLARSLARTERALAPGTLVLSGGLTAPFDLDPGRTVSAEAGELGDVTMSVRRW